MLAPAFADPPADAARAYRAIMEAMARPGTIHEVAGAAPDGLSPAAGAVILCLCDEATPLLLAGPAAAARGWAAFHTGAPPAVDPGGAMFAAGPWDALGPLAAHAPGTPDYPDRSATLIVEMPRLAAEGTRLTGPGIETEVFLNLPDPDALAWNAARYPLGVDLILCCGTRLAALPRSTRIG